jgi:6-phosphogluconolactonase
MKEPSLSSVKKIALSGGGSANLVLCENLAELSARAADLLKSCMSKKPFSLVLSGGSTPRAVHEVLSESALDWREVYFFWGDERCVPPDHTESNYRMARETLLSKISVMDSQIYRMHGESEPEIAALDYEKQIRSFFRTGNSIPSFDFVFLGLGEDCHTASLFPETEAVNRMDRLVVSNYVQKLRSNRLTMTFPLLNQASNVAFLISGESKAKALQTILQGDHDPMKYPAQGIRPVKGALYFFVDQPAAKLLDNVER